MLSELIRAKIIPVDTSKPKDYSSMFRSNRNRLSRTQKTKKSSKVLDNVLSNLDSTIKDIDDSSKPSGPGVSAGERFAIGVKELDIENTYDNIKYLENKLKDNSLAISEYKKMSDDIDELKKNLLKKQQELYDDKQDLEKRIRTNQARSFKDQNK